MNKPDSRSDAQAHSAPSKLKLLVIDDDDLVIATLRTLVPPDWSVVSGLGADLTNLGAQASAALVDMHLTGDTRLAQGLDALKELSRNFPQLELIAMSGNLDRKLMEQGLKSGASRFLPKPLGRDELRITLEKIQALLALRSTSTTSAASWIGGSPASQLVLRQIAQLKGEQGPILILGESGTGKEVAAHLLHAQEGPNRPLIALNVGAIPETVFESELFGHVKGAFTGADQNKIGLAEAANGGDLFLDEIEALPLANQAKLLRLLESGEVRRVGGRDTIRVNIRVIAAGNRDLGEMVRAKEFREDLLWRLQGKSLRLPPLRERPQDVGDLAAEFLSRQRPRRNKTMADDAVQALMRHQWPGNVRELKRICEQLSLYSPLPIIRGEDVASCLPLGQESSSDEIDLDRGLDELVARFEAKVVRKVLETEDDIDRAAERIGISRSSLYKKMKDYGIERL